MLDWEDGRAWSQALDHLQAYMDLLAAGFNDTKPQEARVAVLRRIIGNTAHIVAAAGVFPSKELDVQTALKEAISYAYPDVVLNPPVPQPTKVYKPDLGVPSDRAAIEVKFVDNIDQGKAVLG